MSAKRYRTSNCLIDSSTREIRCNGDVIEVEAKVFDLILLLLEHRQRAMPKREIIDALWPARPVTDAALSQLLRKARRALGDDGDAQRVIRTVHGHGLQWIAAILDDDITDIPAVSDPAAETDPRDTSDTAAVMGKSTRTPQRLRMIAAVLALATLMLVAAWAVRSPPRLADPTRPIRIAVLPVLDHTGDDQLSWTQRGLMGLMASLLEQQAGFDVIAAGDIQSLVDGPEPASTAHWPQLQRGLGATHAVVTELRRTGPIHQLEVRLLGASGTLRTETLHGTAAAPVAADAVKRVQEWLTNQPATSDNTLARDIHDPFIAEVYARGISAQLQGDRAGAKKYFDICLDHAPDLAWPRLQLAVAQGRTDESAASIDNASRVASMARARGDRRLLVHALRQIASAHYRAGDLAAAAALLDEALTHVANDLANSAALHLAYGSIEDDRARYAEARKHYGRALQLARDSHDLRGEADVLINLAGVENSEGNAEAASLLLRSGLDAARSAGDRDLEGVTLANLGATEHNAGRTLSAITLLTQGMSLARQRNDRHLYVLTAIQLSWALAPFGREDTARTLARNALDAGERDGNPFWQAEAHWALANLAERRGETASALQQLAHAQRLYEAGEMTRNASQVLADRARIASRAGDAVQARGAVEAFQNLTQSTAGEASAPPALTLMTAQLRHAEGDYEAALAMLPALILASATRDTPTAQAALFQLGRWQIEHGRYAELLAEPAWEPWLQQSPEAIELRIAALHARGRDREAAAEQSRLGILQHAAELDLDPDLLRLF